MVLGIGDHWQFKQYDSIITGLLKDEKRLGGIVPNRLLHDSQEDQHKACKMVHLSYTMHKDLKNRVMAPWVAISPNPEQWSIQLEYEYD